MTDQERQGLLAALVAREGAAAVRVERFAGILGWGRTKTWCGIRDGTIRAVKNEGRTTVPLTEAVRILAEGMAEGAAKGMS